MLVLLHKLELRAIYRWFVIGISILLSSLLLRQGMGFLSIFFLLYILEQKNYIYALLLGITTTISILVSPDIGIMIFAIILLYYICSFIQVKKIEYQIKTLVLFLGGLTVSFALFMVWALSEGWFWQYIATTIDVITSLSGFESSIGYAFPNALAIVETLQVKELFSREMILYWGIGTYITATFYFFVKAITKKLSSQDKKIFFIYLFGFFLYLILIGRWGLGHFFFVLPPLSIILVYFMQSLIDTVIHTKKNNEKIYALIIVCFILLFFLRIIKFNLPQIADKFLVVSDITKNKTEPQRIGPILISDQQERYAIALTKYVDRNTSINDSIFFFSNEPLYYMITNRKNPSSYDLPYIATSASKRYEMLHDFIKTPPKYIFNDTAEWAVDGVSNAKRLPEIVRYIKKNYKKAVTIQHTIIYELKPSPTVE